MSLSKIDWEKPTTLLATDYASFQDRGAVLCGPERLLLLFNLRGEPHPVLVDAFGRLIGSNVAVVRNKPEPERELWLNLYERSDGTVGAHAERSLEVAKDYRSVPTARVRITYRPGQFDEEPTQ